MPNIEKYTEKICRFNQIVEVLTERLSEYHPEFRKRLCIRLAGLVRNIEQNHHKISFCGEAYNFKKSPEPPLKITVLAMAKNLFFKKFLNNT